MHLGDYKKGGYRMKRCPTCKNVFLPLLLAVSMLLFTTAFIDDASATEGGGGAYPNGAEDFMVGAQPPPGTYFINYLTYYRASKFTDKDGDKLIPDFSLDAVANVFRLIHVTNYQILGANWGVQAFLPIVYLDVSVPGRDDDRWGIGDVIVDPLILGWHSKNWHVTTGIDIYIPVGTYNDHRLANPGRNYWTFEPVVAFTFLSDGGFELSSKFMYDFNTENEATDYQSGQEFHFDYTIGYHLNQSWALGLGGYYYHQTTNDEIDGTKVEPDGFKGQVFAIGPQVKYDYKNMSFTLKWQREFEVENRPEGDKFWFKFMYVF
jgi:hypothetical protein